MMQFSSYSLLELVDDCLSVKANNKSDNIFLCSFFHIQLKQLKRTRTQQIHARASFFIILTLLFVEVESILEDPDSMDIQECAKSLLEVKRRPKDRRTP